MEELRREFDRAIRQSIDESIRIGYIPTNFINMIEHAHPVEVTKRLIIAGDIQTGFTRLIGLGRPDLTIESICLEERFRPLFNRQELVAAQWRLDQAHQNQS